MDSDYNFFLPLTREEWERTLDEAIKVGLSKPGETYEDYLAFLASAKSDASQRRSR